jgi:hypothetical protein
MLKPDTNLLVRDNLKLPDDGRDTQISKEEVGGSNLNCEIFA